MSATKFEYGISKSETDERRTSNVEHRIEMTNSEYPVLNTQPRMP
jgi:hypothetical protein